ncbi:hypothetical protein [Clostridium sp. UBA6640]|uniref:hypothetical protein n=1 Tax=Clostridium sp. UBA6640 TaxID=1946370 RepID=UPI0025C419F6|nr:hypothetical protein [Clostridium sp. UBA6640]
MKKIISILLIITLLFTVSACKQKTDLELQKNNEVVEDNNDSKKEEDVKKEEGPQIKEIKKGEVVSIDNYCELTVNDTKFDKIISPPNAKGVYTCYEVEGEGKTLFESVINVKNLLPDGKMADEFLSVKILYNKYEYGTSSIIEYDDGSDFTYTNITSIEPLGNGVLHFLATVPKIMESDNKPLAIIIKANKQEFKYNIR